MNPEIHVDEICQSFWSIDSRNWFFKEFSNFLVFFIIITPNIDGNMATAAHSSPHSTDNGGSSGVDSIGGHPSPWYNTALAAYSGFGRALHSASP